MESGDRVKVLTDKMGIKQCGGCKRRQEWMNEKSSALSKFTRRVFMGRSAGAAAICLLSSGKNGALKFLYETTNTPVPLNGVDVIPLMRMVMMAELDHYLQDQHHLGLQDVLNDVASHRDHFGPDHSGYPWMSQFTPMAYPSVLPGWTMDFGLREKGQAVADLTFQDGFTMTLSNRKYVLICDETTPIYKAPVPSKPVDLTKTTAKQYPGAEPLLENPDPAPLRGSRACNGLSHSYRLCLWLQRNTG